jgi:hypothetical protein
MIFSQRNKIKKGQKYNGRLSRPVNSISEKLFLPKLGEQLVKLFLDIHFIAGRESYMFFIHRTVRLQN